ncbi:hypothetical protein DESUT3_28870 [Desulfuromonas versatilis]|uniref:histidine kinase n=1 Tax=Desulfuromonas versatilis TaxID=2802975 RepID=A0ABM8HZ75_9BACT|nr:ATP-binding protein [Desulfuromonas versatilis]BCR05818.1 hypothetical protein DESUT3_28870 [Desulfuromonas versatilis]
MEKTKNKKLGLSIRFKIMFSLLLLVSTAVGIITFTMANLFHTDKTAYIHDLTSTMALHTTTEVEAMLGSYRERSEVFARIMLEPGLPGGQKEKLLQQLFEDFREFVAVALYRDGVEAALVYDAAALDQAGLTKEDLQAYRLSSPITADALEGLGLVENSTLAAELPTLTLVSIPAGGSDEQVVMTATVRLETLLRLARQSEVFDSFLLDSRGNYLAHSDPLQIGKPAKGEWLAQLGEDGNIKGLVRALEFAADGREMVGAFARTSGQGLLVGVQIPKTAAYLTTRELLNHLVVVSLMLLVVAALLSLVWSRRITRPLERLSQATRSIGQGNFGIQVEVRGSDEIGELASSFNRMAGELHHREQALRQAQAQLLQSEKMAAFGQLGAGIAHEVKNPLAGILGFAQLALRKAESESTLHKHLSIIEKETKRCQKIIENLMKFARRENVEFQPTDLNAVVTDAAAIVEHQLGIAKIRIERDLGSELPRFNGSGNQIQQVLMNLMLNAQQAMKGEPGEVRLTTRQLEDGALELRVSDTGPGMPKEVRDRIFEPFFTTKPSGEGTGLGLSVSYRIIEDHGGQIRVESEPGEGATFVITLPQHQAVVGEQETAMAPAAAGA